MSPLVDRKRVGTVLKWTGIVVVALVAVVLVALTLIDWNGLRGPIARFAEARLHRPVAIENLDVDVWSLTPRATITGLTVGNPEWEERKTMLEVERVALELKVLYLLRGDIVLTRVSIDKPVLYLHRADQKKANWEFSNPQGEPRQPDSDPPELPVVRRLLVNDGRIEITDEVRKLRFQGAVQAKEQASGDASKPFRLEGKGELNDKPFDLEVAGGPLINLDPEEPYSFEGNLHAADIELAIDGTLSEPFDLGRFTAKLEMSGQDLADLFYLTNLALPNTPPYELSGTLERKDTAIKLSKIAGKVGGSDLRGSLSIDTGGKRPQMQGNLASDQLNFADLAAPLGARTAAKQATLDAQGKSQAPSTPAPRLFPDASLQAERVRAMDADVRYAARAVNAGKVPLERVVMHIKLENGVLALQPVTLEFPQGRLSATVNIDAREDVPKAELDMHLSDLRLDQFVARKPDAQPAFTGIMQARAKLQGSGDSIREVASTAAGTFTAVVPQAEVRAAFAELTGINVARGLGLLLAKDQEKSDVRCGIAHFEVADGVMHGKHIVFDTKDVLITGRGEVRLRSEELDLKIEGEPKEVRLVRLRSPIEIGGHLRKPSVGIDAGKTAGQAGIAAAIGALVAPLAAVVAFVDPGLAENADCASLLAEAESHGASVKGEPQQNPPPPDRRTAL